MQKWGALCTMGCHSALGTLSLSLSLANLTVSRYLQKYGLAWNYLLFPTVMNTTVVQHIKPRRMQPKFTHNLFSNRLVNHDNVRCWPMSGRCPCFWHSRTSHCQERVIWFCLFGQLDITNVKYPFVILDVVGVGGE